MAGKKKTLKSKQKVNRTIRANDEPGRKKLSEMMIAAKRKEMEKLDKSNAAYRTDIEIYKKKTEDLRIKMKEENRSFRKLYNDSCAKKKILEVEIRELKQKIDSLPEENANAMREQYEEFLKAAGEIKSTIAIYVGRNNKIEEFTKEVKGFEQKTEDTLNKFKDRNDKYDAEIKNYELDFIDYQEYMQTYTMEKLYELGMLIESEISPSRVTLVKLEKILEKIKEQYNDIKRKRAEQLGIPN